MLLMKKIEHPPQKFFVKCSRAHYHRVFQHEIEPFYIQQQGVWVIFSLFLFEFTTIGIKQWFGVKNVKIPRFDFVQ